VNRRWHYDLTVRSAPQLISVARCLWRRGESQRKTHRQIEEWIRSGIRNGDLAVEQIPNDLLGQLRLSG